MYHNLGLGGGPNFRWQYMHYLNMFRYLFILVSVSLFIASNAISHSGGTDAFGCHAGSRPYHCHTPKTPRPSEPIVITTEDKKPKLFKDKKVLEQKVNPCGGEFLYVVGVVGAKALRVEPIFGGDRFRVDLEGVRVKLKSESKNYLKEFIGHSVYIKFEDEDKKSGYVFTSREYSSLIDFLNLTIIHSDYGAVKNSNFAFKQLFKLEKNKARLRITNYLLNRKGCLYRPDFVNAIDYHTRVGRNIRSDNLALMSPKKVNSNSILTTKWCDMKNQFD